MKYLILILSLFLFIQTAYASIVDVPSESLVPTGYTKDSTDQLYKNGTEIQYRVIPKSTPAGDTQANGTSPDTSTESNIFNGKVDDDDLKAGKVDMYTIPIAIAGMIELVLGIAGTMAIVALIYNAVQMQINSGITGDSTGVEKAKKGMYGALMGFVVTLLAWFIVSRVIQILVSST